MGKDGKGWAYGWALEQVTHSLLNAGPAVQLLCCYQGQALHGLPHRNTTAQTMHATAANRGWDRPPGAPAAPLAALAALLAVAALAPAALALTLAAFAALAALLLVPPTAAGHQCGAGGAAAAVGRWRRQRPQLPRGTATHARHGTPGPVCSVTERSSRLAGRHLLARPALRRWRTWVSPAPLPPPDLPPACPPAAPSPSPRCYGNSVRRRGSCSLSGRP